METPYLHLDIEKLKKNILDMADFARAHGVSLRPHIKAHKTPEIARMQIEAGAVGITVAKLGEAEVMFQAGIADILVAYPLIGERKLKRAETLIQSGCKLTLLVDSRVGAQGISRMNIPGGVDVLVKVDSGLGRCGLQPDESLIDFVKWLVQQKSINFKGVLTHAGHAYGCDSFQGVQEIGLREGQMMVEAADDLRRQGIEVETVSIGSTPTAKIGGKVPGVTEIRPGNYVFYDATQVSLGVVGPDHCSLKVRTTVVSRPAQDRAIIDAGAKVLALDKGAHGGGSISGFGMLKNADWELARLSEEHGVIIGSDLPQIGEELDIIPNHACPVVNLADLIHVSDGSIWKVMARGAVT